MDIGKWMYNLTGNETWWGEAFETKEEAIKEGRKEAKKEELDIMCISSFEVGQIAEVPISGIDVDFVLENVAENTTDECGEVGDDYLSDVTKEDEEELEEKLNEVLFAWIEEHNYKPDFYKIENIETIEL